MAVKRRVGAAMTGFVNAFLQAQEAANEGDLRKAQIALAQAQADQLISESEMRTIWMNILEGQLGQDGTAQTPGQPPGVTTPDDFSALEIPETIQESRRDLLPPSTFGGPPSPPPEMLPEGTFAPPGGPPSPAPVLPGLTGTFEPFAPAPDAEQVTTTEPIRREAIASVLPQMPARFDPNEQRWGVLGEMGKVLGVPIDVTSFRGDLTETPEYLSEQAAREALVTGAIGDILNPAIFETDVIGPRGTTGRFFGRAGDVFGGEGAALRSSAAQLSPILQQIFRGIPTQPGAAPGVTPGTQIPTGPQFPLSPTPTGTGLEVPPTGVAPSTFGGAQGMVTRTMSPRDLQMLQELPAVYQTLDRIEFLSRKLNTEAGLTATMTGLGQWLSANANRNPEAAELIALSKAYAAQFVRLGGEGASRLSDQDIDRALSGIPSMFRSQAITDALMKFARGLLDAKRISLIRGFPDWFMSQEPSVMRGPEGAISQPTTGFVDFEPDAPPR